MNADGHRRVPSADKGLYVAYARIEKPNDDQTRLATWSFISGTGTIRSLNDLTQIIDHFASRVAGNNR